jgi:uncharacterized protein
MTWLASDSWLFHAVFVTRWPWYLGGVGVALVALALLWVDNRQLGVSSGLAQVGQIFSDPGARKSWRLPFVGGIVLGGALAGFLAGGLAHPASSKLPLLLAGGLLVGYGARLAGGCTSGHAIMGVALGSKTSMLAAAAFMAGGFAATFVMARLGVFS